MAFHITTDHESIRTWVEQHNGRPAVVRGVSDPLASLSILWEGSNVPKYRDLEEISWDEFFDMLETNRLAFRYSDEAGGVDEELSVNFIDRETIPALDDHEFILPEDNEMARENMFPSAPAVEEGDVHWSEA